MNAMQRSLICLCACVISGCDSSNSLKSDVSSNKTLLVITSYVDFPNNRLILYRDGTYNWKKFDKENYIWQDLLSGNLEQSELANIEKQLPKSSSGLHWTRQTEVKDEFGKKVELEIFRVVRKNDHFGYNFSELDSSTMSPEVIKVVLDKCGYIKMLEKLGIELN